MTHEVSAATLRRAHAVHPIAAVQSEYSLCTRNPDIAVIETCRSIGATFVAFSPLARGFLTGDAGGGRYRELLTGGPHAGHPIPSEPGGEMLRRCNKRRRDWALVRARARCYADATRRVQQ
jgi:aryl-alcohol dehydrogenase-like predicted oxidoreductase